MLCLIAAAKIVLFSGKCKYLLKKLPLEETIFHFCALWQKTVNDSVIIK
jgi:hypothetical protein